MSRGGAPDLQLNTEGGRFEQVAFLGRGASGLVFRVRDRRSGAEVALKTLDQRDPEKLYRLKQEFRALSGIRHPNLVKLYELHAAGDEGFFTMELIEGVDFVTWVGARRDPLTGALLDGDALERFVAAARQLVHGLAALHGEGKLHRDVKPPNVLVERDGRVVLLDFGFVRGFGGRVLANEQSEGAAGSLAYMAPEVLWGKEATPESDWYGVGVLFHEALSGRLPFDGPPAALLAGRPAQPLAPLPGLPDELNRMLAALLAREPGERWGAGEILAALDALSPAGAGAEAAVAPARVETPFVGRDAELAALRAAYELVTPYQPVVAHVRGASGIGKSELLRRFLTRLEREEGVVVLRGRCHPHEAVPYRAFDGLIDALSLYLAGLPPEAVAALAPRHAEALATLFPVLARVPAFAPQAAPSGELQEIRRRGFGALRELLARLSDRRRVVLWIDDAQWGDSDSAALSRELFRPPDPPGLLFVLSYRAEDREAAAALAPEESDERGSARTRVVEVGPLAEEDTRRLAAELAGAGTLDLAAVVSESRGSPFFVDQLVRSVAARREAASATRPELGRVVERRLARLGSSARLLLEVASVAGRPLSAAVALEAAGLGAAARMELIDLQEERLLRSGADAGADTVEIYHDRIGEALVDLLDGDARRARHRGLAHALVKQPQPDAQALYRHYLGADEREPAAHWAVEAAERADAALAFAEAAQLYAGALELIADETRRPPLQVKRATALVNAGRGAEAAPIFMDAAGKVAGTESLELRRRGAEQYLLTGRIEDGVTAMRALLQSLGLRYPRTPLGAALSTGVRLVTIAARRPATAPLPRESALPPLQSVRIEASRSAAKGLAMVDPFRGLYFAVLTLGLALRAGDPHRIARELAGVGATLLPAGGPPALWAGHLIERARSMAVEFDDPYLLGFTSIIAAQKSMVAGRWREMLTLCDTGTAILRERCRGVTWELAIGSGAAERALEELGDFKELARRVEDAMIVAENSGDMYRAVSALENIALVRIAQNRILEARTTIDRARARIGAEGFHMQHFYMERVEAYCDLAEGCPDTAVHRVDRMWPKLVRSNLLRHCLIKTDAHLLRARARLAEARHHSERRDHSVRVALADAKVLRQQDRLDARAHGRMIEGAAARLHGRDADALSLLTEAQELFLAAEMRSQCSVAEILRSKIDSGRSDPGATVALHDLGIASVPIFLSVHAPGFDDARTDAPS